MRYTSFVWIVFFVNGSLYAANAGAGEPLPPAFLVAPPPDGLVHSDDEAPQLQGCAAVPPSPEVLDAQQAAARRLRRLGSGHGRRKSDTGVDYTVPPTPRPSQEFDEGAREDDPHGVLEPAAVVPGGDADATTPSVRESLKAILEREFPGTVALWRRLRR